MHRHSDILAMYYNLPLSYESLIDSTLQCIRQAVKAMEMSCKILHPNMKD